MGVENGGIQSERDPRDIDLISWLFVAAVGHGRDRNEAFYQMWPRLTKVMLPVCMRVLMNPQDAEDAMQDAAINLWRRARTFDDKYKNPDNWLRTIARNAALVQLRRRKTHQCVGINEQLDSVEEPGFEEAEAGLQETFVWGIIEQNLDKLWWIEAKCVFFHLGSGYNISKIAETIDVDRGVVSEYLFSGLEKLQDVLRANGYDRRNLRTPRKSNSGRVHQEVLG